MRSSPGTHRSRVEVLPFELVFQNHTVYEEHDRERSLAFRLFRDGVRKLTFEPGIGWDDLVSLLEVMSVRCTGIRQQEEDLITLLRKARFENITIDSVEGYTPDEEMPENQALAPMVEESNAFDPTPDWDQPLPAPSGGKVQYQPIDADSIYALLDEETPEAISAQAVRAVYELLQTANSLKDPELRQQLIPFVEEVQQFLIVQRDLNELARLAVVYRDAFGDGRTLPVLAEERSFERIMRMVTEQEEAIPPALYHLLGAPSPDVVSRAIDMLEFGAKGARRKALLEVVAHGSKAKPSLVVDRLGTAAPELARDLFALLGRIAPDARTDAAFLLLEQDNEELQLELAVDHQHECPGHPPGERLASANALALRNDSNPSSRGTRQARRSQSGPHARGTCTGPRSGRLADRGSRSHRSRHRRCLGHRSDANPVGVGAKHRRPALPVVQDPQRHGRKPSPHLRRHRRSRTLPRQTERINPPRPPCSRLR